MKTKLGIFDSGVGGFTVLREILQRYGALSCVYLGDTARVPYGEKSIDEIRSIAREIVDWLNDQNVTHVLMACNTTNSLAGDIVKQFSNAPVIGLIEVVPKMIEENRIGVLSTPATFSSRAYSKEIHKSNQNIFVIEKSCPELVPLIEAGDLHSKKLREVLVNYLSPLLEASVKAIVLGCSHYPLINSLLRELIPKEVRLINPAIGLVNQLGSFLGDSLKPVINNDEFKNIRICATSNPIGFSNRANLWLGKSTEVELISLSSKAIIS